ncbi:ATP-binding cassette domain-containing protein [Cobetia amphilecti]|uniref:ATP-binding cassette domain-containing protein n=1 Tax=Cobetia amphilecti TaxID=1055104 RepID=UPI00254CD458|nr:ATP-binding cassette domain-containing protein [Cobetia amphilecti]
MIALRQLALQRGGAPLIDEADLTLHAGHKAGIVGPNGAGKSSLFGLILGELTPDSGTVSLAGGVRVAHMAQEIDALERPIVDYVMDGDHALRETERALAAAEESGEHQRQAELHAHFDTLDGYTARARAEQLLVGLGFSQAQLSQPLAAFSGGWRMRANLARTLFTPSDLLLLDEPTNHLDLDALLWLEQWLARYPGALLLISHDRDFLDAVCDHIIHFDRRKLVVYKGNYSRFERTRSERLVREQVEHEKTMARRAEIEDFVRRFKAKATKARQAQSRMKMLERMEETAAVKADSPFHFTIPCSDKISHPLLGLDRAVIGYPGQPPQLSGVRFSLLPGQRIGLLGPNGAGKSTLIKALTGELALVEGQRTAGEHLAIGYFAQHQVDGLDLSSTPFNHVLRLSPSAGELEIRTFLGSFGFHGDEVYATVESFSGGEKARLALSLIAWQKPNLLLLDEPTNHLDLDMREALTDALATFEGTVILVSHDRHLLRACVDEFWCIADGRVTPFDGDLDDYRAWLKARVEGERREARAQKDAYAGTDSTRTPDRKEARRQAAELREKLRPLKKVSDKAEQKMSKAQGELDKIEEALGDATLYEADRKAELTKLLASQGEIKSRLDEAEAEWFEAQEALEEMEAQLKAAD